MVRPPASAWTYRWRTWEYLVRQARPFWLSAVAEAVLAPLAYLVAFGVGLGSLVDRNGGAALGGVPYLHYIAPALLCGAAVQIAFNESAFALYGRFEWARVLWGITATPVSPTIAADAHLMWVATRVAGSALGYYLVLLAFGAGGGFAGLLMIPIAVLTALACAVWIMTVAATVTRDGPVYFNLVLRFGVIPMTLFSASFFPIEQLPWTVRWLALISPLWHGNELARGVAMGGLPAGQAAIHLAFLLVVAVAGYLVLRQRFVRRLVI